MSSVPWFETPLMNAVQRDLAGWPSEKLSERSALLRLNDATAVTFSVRQKRLFMASIHSCEFVVEGPVTRPVRGNIRCLLYTSPSPRDRQKSRMPSSA